MTEREKHQFADVLDELLCGGEIARGSWPKGMRLVIEVDPSSPLCWLRHGPGYPQVWVPRRDDLGASDWIIVTAESQTEDPIEDARAEAFPNDAA